MKLRIASTALITILAATICALPVASFAHDDKDKPVVHHGGPSGPATIKVEMNAAQGGLVAGKEISALIKLTDAKGQPVAFENLKTAHTKKIHLLIIDESLTDYHHEHPMPTGKPGEYSFTFRPKNGGNYTVFADLLPTATGKQEYAKTEVAVQGGTKALDESAGTRATVDGYRFDLSAEGGNTLRVGDAKLVKVKVTKPDGQPADILEPVMGAFAHGVGFPSDRSGVVHVHPMGKEPEKASERGGPELTFHIIPEHPGYMKFYVQVQIDGRDRFAGFGFKVDKEEPAAATAEPPAASTLTATQKQFLDQYEAIRVALAADDFAAAKKAAKAIADKDKGQQAAAGQIAKSDSIKAAREAFKLLSAEAAKLATSQPGYFVMACPMVENGKWVQTNRKVANPYMGAAMLGCGAIKN